MLVFMSKKIIIELSIVEEGQLKSYDDIINDINAAFSQEEIVIPWCGKVEKISLDET